MTPSWTAPMAAAPCQVAEMTEINIKQVASDNALEA